MQMMTGKFREACDTLPEEMLMLTEIELEDRFLLQLTDRMLRQKLWKKIDEAKALGRTEVLQTEVYEGIMTRQNFYKTVLSNPYRIAWLMIRPSSFEDLVDIGLELTIRKLVMYVSETPVDSKTLGQITRLAEFFANRSKGPVVQKIEQRTVSAHMRVDAKAPTAQALESELKQVQELLVKSEVPHDQKDPE